MTEIIVEQNSGESNSMSNQGTGEGVFAQKVGIDLQLKSLVAGAGIGISSSADEILITASASAPAWGEITGTLSNQTDLQAALDGKATSAQGTLADSATQPGDNISTLTNDSAFISDITGDAIGSLSNVTVTEGAGIDGYRLTYDHGTGQWIAAAAGGTGSWGSITGTLSNQTDLQAELDGKATSAQGSLADSASQPGHTHVKANITDFSDGDYATSAQGTTADSALQDITGELIGSLNNVNVTEGVGIDGYHLSFDNGTSKWIAQAPTGSPTWGGISGTLSNQTDLQGELDGKATSAQGALADSASQPGHAHVKTDITDFSEGDYATAAQGTTADSATQPGDNNSTLTNDSGYITSFTETDPVFLAQKAAANGVATLGADSKIPTSQLPALAITETSVVASEAAMLALTAQTGDVAVRTDESKSYILAGTDPSVLGDWQELLTPTDSVLSVNGFTGAITLTTTDITEGTNLYYTDGRVDARPLVANAVQPNDNVSVLINDAGYLVSADLSGYVLADGTTIIQNTGTNTVQQIKAGSGTTVARVSLQNSSAVEQLAISANGSTDVTTIIDQSTNGLDISSTSSDVSIQGIVYPSADGNAGDMMVTDGSGVISFTPPVDEAAAQTTSASFVILQDRPITLGTSIKYTINIVGRTSGGDTYATEVQGAAKNQANTASLVGANSFVDFIDAGASTWQVVVEIPSGVESLRVKVAGEAATTVDWTMQITVVEA